MSEQVKDEAYQGPPTDPVKAMLDAARMVKDYLAKQEQKDKEHEAAMEELGKTMELTKAELEQWHRELQAMHGRPPSWVRTVWNAFWHGAGVAKAEGDKVFKE